MSDLMGKVDYQWCFENSEEAADLIEQLQARVVELERENKKLDKDLEREIDIRDSYHEWADKLADIIARVFDVDIGEHSSANNPWANACDAENQIDNRVSILQKERDALEAHVERLNSACQLAYQTPLDDYYRLHVNVSLYNAIHSTPTTSLAERDAEVARKAYEQGVYDACECENQEMSLDEIESWAPDAANEYAERVKRG